MSFNTAPKLFSVGKFLVVTFVMSFSFNGYAQDAATATTTTSPAATGTVVINKTAKDKRIDACRSDDTRKSYKECEDIYYKELNDRADAKRNKEHCEEKTADFDKTLSEFRSQCSAANLGSSVSKCHEEINKCSGDQQKTRSTRRSTKRAATTCDLYARTGLDSSLSDHEDKYDRVQDLIEEISELNITVQNAQADQEEILSNFEIEEKAMLEAAQDITIKTRDDLIQLGYTEKESALSFQENLTRLAEQRNDLTVTQPAAINSQYTDSVTTLNETCIESSLASLQTYRDNLAANKNRNRTQNKSLSSGTGLEAYYESKLRACNARSRTRLAQLARERDRQLTAIETQATSLETTIKNTEARILDATERASTTRLQLLEKGQLDYNRQIERAQELAKNTNTQLNRLKLTVTQTQQTIAQKQKQLQDAEKQLEEASKKLETAKTESGGSNIDRSDVLDVISGHQDLRTTAQALRNKCGCGTPTQQAGTEEKCKSADSYTGTSSSRSSRTRSTTKSGTKTDN